MAKEIDLLSYWMPLLRQLKEFKEIAKTEEPELRYILEAIDRTLNNMFIDTADEYGIKRFEDMMGIYPDEGATLDSRKFAVLVKWNDKVPYTDNELYNRLISLCGSADKFTITERYNEYAIDIATHLGVAGAFDTVALMLREMLPSNLVLNLSNTIEAIKTSLLSFGVVTCTAMAYEITNDINKADTGNVAMNYAIGIANGGSHIITHDIKSVASKDIPFNTALVNSVGNVLAGITHDVTLEDDLTGSLVGGVGVGVATTQIITHDLNSKANVAGNYAVGNSTSKATVITLN